MAINIISFLIFTLGVAAISWWYTRKTELSHSSAGYFLGGRNMGAILIASSLLLTNLSTEQLVGLNGSAYKHGMEVMAWETLAALAMVSMALFFLPKYLKMGLVTITQYLEIRFDKQTRVICSALFLLLYITTLLPIVLYIGAINMESIFDVSKNLNISLFQGTVLMVVGIGVLGGAYAILGGLKAIAVSDLINGIGLIVGGALIPIFAFYKIGDGEGIVQGANTVFNAVPDHFNSIGDSKSDVPFSVLFTGMFIPQVFYWTMNQSIIQKSFAAKDLATGQRGVLLTAFLKIFIPFLMVIPGIIAYYYFDIYLKTPLPNGDYAYPELVKAVLPKGLTGIFAAVIAGAVLSTFNGALNSAATLFSIDIYKEYINPKATETQVVKSGKISGTIMAIIVIAAAPFIGILGDGLYLILQEFSSVFNMPIFAVILSGLLLKKVSAQAAKIGLVAGTILYVLSKIGVYFFNLGKDIHFLHILALAFFTTIGIIVIASKYFPRTKEDDLSIIKETNTINLEHWKYVKPVSLLVVIITILMFITFSPLGIISK